MWVGSMWVGAMLVGSGMPSSVVRMWVGQSRWRMPAWAIAIKRPTISLQRTRFAPQDRRHFEIWFRADCLADLDCAPLNSVVRRHQTRSSSTPGTYDTPTASKWYTLHVIV